MLTGKYVTLGGVTDLSAVTAGPIALRQLSELEPVPRTDKYRSDYPPELVKHPGKMRPSLVLQALQWLESIQMRYSIHQSTPLMHSGAWGALVRSDLASGAVPVLADPMAGAGSTAIAYYVRYWDPQRPRLRMILNDVSADYVTALTKKWGGRRHFEVYREDASAYRMPAFGSPRPGGPLRARHDGPFVWPDPHVLARSVLFTSPPFPNAKSQGGGATQEHFQSTKSTFAGNDMPMQSQWRGRKGYSDMLCDVLMHPCYRFLGIKMLHVKNYVHRGVVQRVDEWTAAALEATGNRVYGYLRAPLGYKSAFQALQQYPLVRVLAGSAAPGSHPELRLACGHTKVVKDGRPKPPKSVRCTTCPKLDQPVVDDERIVVATWSAATAQLDPTFVRQLPYGIELGL